MNRFLRSSKPGWADYATLAFFAVTFLATAAFVVSPQTFAADPRERASANVTP